MIDHVTNMLKFLDCFKRRTNSMNNDIENENIAAQFRKPLGNEGIQLSHNMNIGNQKITSHTIAALNLKAGDTVIEIGPGNGLLSIPVLNKIGPLGRYTAIDYSADMIEEIKKNLSEQACKNITIIYGDCQHLSEKLQQSNALFAVNVLYFIKDLEIFLNLIQKWLLPGARVAFGVESKQSLEEMPYTKYDFIVRCKEEYLNAFTNSQYSDIKYKTFDDGVVNFNGTDFLIESWVISGTIPMSSSSS